MPTTESNTEPHDDHRAALHIEEPATPVRTLHVILGDQLDRDAPSLGQLDASDDALLMMEVDDEAQHVPSHKQRTVLFLSAMRHFALDMVERGLPVRYVRLDDPAQTGSLMGEIRRAARELQPERIVVVQPGAHRLRDQLAEIRDDDGLPIEIIPEAHFIVDRDWFEAWAKDRKRMVMEHFYRAQRREHDILLTEDGSPEGGEWNYDEDNREAFDDQPASPEPFRVTPDAITREVMALVQERFPDAPGNLEAFGWPVTPEHARRALDDFVTHRLRHFGTHQDAMWRGEPFLYHALLSSSLNLKLLRPMDVVDAALDAWRAGDAPLNAVEGFVRQIIGWREFVRGVYDHEGPGYEDRNGLHQHGALPEFFWTAETDMACVSDTVQRVLDHGYGHHIERLMVIGNLALIAGVAPRHVHDWFLGMYVDGVAWVTAPNTIGMSQHADGGVVGTKPYAASGKYIDRMSNFCSECRYDVSERVGESACPFNVLYWDFLLRKRDRLDDIPRMGLMLANAARMDDDTKSAVRDEAKALRDRWGVGDPSS